MKTKSAAWQSADNATDMFSCWLNTAIQSRPQINSKLLEKSAEIIIRAHDDADQNTALIYNLSQGLIMADLLLEFHPDSNSLATAMVYPSYKLIRIKHDDIKQNLNATTANLLKGVARTEAISLLHDPNASEKSNQQRIDKIRKMFLAMVDDVRVVVIKLVSHLADLIALKDASETDQKALAEYTMSIYAPLANRLGIGQLKWQLEDFGLRYQQPEAYKSIAKSLKMKRIERESFIVDMTTTLESMAKSLSLDHVKITGRPKHIYSIHQKIERKKVDISEIYDALAIRALLPTISDCYALLSAVHAKWPHIAKEFDDYIAKPKPNGYRSIHTAITAENDYSVEIQFRTFQMHEEAELGVAAHWVYKEGPLKQSSYQDKINWFRQMMDWQKEVSEDNPDAEDIYAQMIDDSIYVFTPTGDVINLEKGATPLDFAYHVHTDVGHRCRGAKVNDQLVQLTTKLKTGDQVSVMTGKENHPSRDWLNPALGYLSSKSAIAKVQHWFHRENIRDHLQAGQEVWDKIAKQENLNKKDLTKACHQLNYKTNEDLLSALGNSDISGTTILKKIKNIHTEKNYDEPLRILEKKAPITNNKTGITVDGVDNVLTQLARCCSPIPGDTVIGYITLGQGISIHQSSCHNIKRAETEKPERLVKAFWNEKTAGHYALNLELVATDRSGLLRDILNCITNEKAKLSNISTRMNRAKQLVTLNLTIDVEANTDINQLSNKLSQLPNMISVQRAGK